METRKEVFDTRYSSWKDYGWPERSNRSLPSGRKETIKRSMTIVVKKRNGECYAILDGERISLSMSE